LNLNDIKENFDFFDLLIIDLFGKLRHVTLPTNYLSEEVFERGVGFDASNTMYSQLTDSDLVIVPDISCTFTNPFSEYKTISSFGNVYSFDSNGDMKLFPLDPRFILKKTLSLLRDKTPAQNLMVLPELEFYVFDKINYSLNPLNSFYSISSNELSTSDGKAYHLIQPSDKFSNLRSEIVKILCNNEVNVKYHHHEVGLPGQCEIELNFEVAEKAADNIEITKYVTKNCAAKIGMTSTFIPKPLYGAPGSGMHLHLYLVDDNGRSIFYDPNNELNLSKIALNFVGGILLHLSSLMAITNPSTNSFKRLIPGFEAPTGKTFGKGDRSSSIRIPGYTSLEATRIEFRTPDAICNPYYAISAILLAGIDGISKNIDPFNDKEIDKTASIPETFPQALEALSKDNEYLSNVFGKDFPEIWCKHKSKETESCNLFPTPAEIATYIEY